MEYLVLGIVIAFIAYKVISSKWESSNRGGDSTTRPGDDNQDEIIK